MQKREETNGKCFWDLDDGNTSDCTLLIQKAPDSEKFSFLVSNVSATQAEVSCIVNQEFLFSFLYCFVDTFHEFFYSSILMLNWS